MNLRTLPDNELLVRAEDYTARRDGLPATAVALIDELAWRLQRQVDEPSTQDPFRMPKFERGPNGRFTNRMILDEAQQHDNGERNQPLLSDVRG